MSVRAGGWPRISRKVSGISAANRTVLACRLRQNQIEGSVDTVDVEVFHAPPVSEWADSWTVMVTRAARERLDAQRHRVRSKRAEAELGDRGTKDGNSRRADCRCEVLRQRVVGDEDRRAPNELGRGEEAELRGRVDGVGAGDIGDGARDVDVVWATDDRDPEARREAFGELSIVGPPFGAPDAAGSKRDDRAIGRMRGEQRVHGAAVVIARVQVRDYGGGISCGPGAAVSEREQAGGVVITRAARYTLGVEQTTRGIVESRACGHAREKGERRAAQRALGEISVHVSRIVAALAPPRAEAARGTGDAGGAAVDTRLVERDHAPNVRIMREQGRGGARRDHVHWPASRELGQERRGEDRVAEERRLDDEGGGHRWAGSLHLQHRQERFLRDLDRPDLLHALLSFLLLFEELALARHVAAVAFGEHVLAERFDGSSRDYFGADSGLDDDLEQLARDELFELVGHLASPLVRFVTVDDDRERVDGVAVDEHVELDEVAGAVFEHLVVEAGVAAAHRLELVVE